MNATINQKCANLACTCTVPPGDAYCCEACRKQVETPLSDQDAGCPCRHVQCIPVPAMHAGN
jgi:hypothetical protein